MSMLTRCIGEIRIIELPDGQEIRVMVANVDGSQVKIGTEAPREIRVRREELLECGRYHELCAGGCR